MTTQEVRLCALLLREHFGEIVEKVGTHLLRSGAQNLRTIIHETGVSLDLVQLLHLVSSGCYCQYFTTWKSYYPITELQRLAGGVMYSALHIVCIRNPTPYILT